METKKNLTTEEAVVIYRALGAAKLGKMADGAKFKVIRILRVLKPLAAAYDDFLKDASERLRPAGAEAIAMKQERGEALTDAERAAAEKYSRDVEACVSTELKRGNELSFEGLTEEELTGLAAANDGWTAGQLMMLADALGAESAPDTAEEGAAR